MYVKALYLPDGIKETAMWVKNHVQPNDKIIFGSDKWNATDQPIIVYSGISLRHFLIIGTPLAKPNLNIRKIVADYLVTKIPHYLVLNSTGCLQQVMNFDMAQKKISDGANEFILIYSYDTSTLGKFNIYEIRYK